MRHADAELQLWLANDRIERDLRDAELASLVRHGGGSPSMRRRAGQAFIALGERLAGDSRYAEPARLAPRAF